MAAQIAMPLRAFATWSNIASSFGSVWATSAVRAADASASAASTPVSSLASAFFLRLDLLLIFRQCRFGLLDVGGDDVGVHHLLEHLLLDGRQVALRGFHLVAERLVFLVGLDRGLLVLELGDPALVDGGFFLEGAAGFLVVLEAIFRVGHALRGVVQPGVGFGEACRMRGDLPPRVVDSGIELLQFDESV